MASHGGAPDLGVLLWNGETGRLRALDDRNVDCNNANERRQPRP
jgi:hypothetical protein